MLSRLVTTMLRKSSIPPVRNFRISVTVLGGGHHHDPVPVYTPKPGPSERNLLGEGKAVRVSHDAPYVPSLSCYGSYIGAAIGVLLTFLAIAYKTDAFKPSSKHHDHSKKHEVKEHAVHKPQESANQEPASFDEVQEPKESKNQHVDLSERQASQTATSDKRNIEVQTLMTTTQQPATIPADLSNNNNETGFEDPFADKGKEQQHMKLEDRQGTQTASSDKRNVGELAAMTMTQDVPSEEIPMTPRIDKIPEYVEYLLVGAGTASYYAALAIRARDANAKVLMIGDESCLPYNRPPLSKELWWYGDTKAADTLKYRAVSGKMRDIFFESKGFFVPPGELPDTKHGGVSIVREKRVTRICAAEKKAYLEDGTVIRFNKCLLATGGKPKKIQELERAPENIKSKIIYLRGIDDYRKLEKICSESKSITVIGGGFLGSELAYSIKRKYPNLELNQVVKEKGNLAHVLPEFLIEKATNSLKKQGVNVITNALVTEAQGVKGKVEITIADKEKIQSDYILVAVGIEPNTDIAKASGFELDSKNGGVVADSELRVQSDIYAAGDVCSFFDRVLGRRRSEHWEHAQISGRLAGENMTGGEKAFWFQSSFFTKFSPDYHLNAVGNTNSRLETVSVFAKDEDDEKFERGVVFYKNKEGKIVGVLMVNVFGASLDVGRRLIEDDRPISNYRELAKLFPLFEQPKDNTTSEENSE